MSASHYERKSHLNRKFSLKMLYPVKTSRRRCASDNISRDNTPILDLWERPHQYFVCVSISLHVCTK